MSTESNDLKIWQISAIVWHCNKGNTAAVLLLFIMTHWVFKAVESEQLSRVMQITESDRVLTRD